LILLTSRIWGCQ